MTRLSLVLHAGERHGANMYVFGGGSASPDVDTMTRDRRRKLARMNPSDYTRYLKSKADLDWWRDIGSKLPRED
jgi:hypothetical protein